MIAALLCLTAGLWLVGIGAAGEEPLLIFCGVGFFVAAGALA